VKLLGARTDRIGRRGIVSSIDDLPGGGHQRLRAMQGGSR
jgi:hypothetical protein